MSTPPPSLRERYTALSAQNKNILTTKEIVIFGVLGAIMFCSKLIMESLPNIHLLGMLTMSYTIVFRKKALYPIYINVLLTGIYAGFNIWWIPYLYIWTILWAVTMVLPRNMPKALKCVVYPIICCMHGLFYGTLYAPAQALFMHMDLKATIAWIVAGFPFDAIHGAGNLVLGTMIYPLSELFRKLLGKNSKA